MTGQAIEAIHVVGCGRAIHVVGHVAATLSQDHQRADTLVALDNRYYRAVVPLRTYAGLASVPECISGALVLVMAAEDERATDKAGELSGVKEAFDELASWWAARKQDEIEVPLVVAWGVGSEDEGEEVGGGMMKDVFAWCVEEGFELVYCPDGDGKTDLLATESTRETSGVERVREALHHHRWSMAEMKAVPSRSGLGISSDEEATADGGEPNWSRMNNDVLRAFSRLAACGSDSDDGAEETFAALASMLRR